MIDLGLVPPGSTIRIPFNSFDKDDGSSITMTNYAVGDVLAYKDGSTTERASTNGFTATTDFDSKTGKHVAALDLADNTTAAFWANGSEYLIGIDAVTVDGVTTGGWIARFRIGYPNAFLNTTIATLSSQTSFTLTTGPAEDDALNGCVVLIHDVASAVQLGFGIISDYTGSTKTVTLLAGVSFTAAATDNISLYPPGNVEWFHALAVTKVPLAPTTAGRDLDVSAGGEAGLDWANIGSPTTAVNLSGTTVKTATDVETDTADIQTRLPAALVSGRMDSSVGAMAANVMTAAAAAADLTTELQSGLATASALSTLDGKVDTIDGIVDAILVDTAEIGAAGAGLSAIPWNAAWDAEVQSEATDALNAYDPPTNAEMVARTIASADYATAAALATVDGIADNLVSGIIFGAAATGTLSTTVATTNLTGYANDQLIGRVLIWLAGDCEGEATDITDYASADGTLTFTALTTAPGNGDTFKIV